MRQRFPLLISVYSVYVRIRLELLTNPASEHKMVITVISVRTDKSLIHFVVLMEHCLFLTQLKTAHNPIVTVRSAERRQPLEAALARTRSQRIDTERDKDRKINGETEKRW